MDKINHTQLELFSAGEANNSRGLEPSKRINFAYIRGYERAVLLAAGFVLVGIIAFSAGVEKGKSLLKAPAAPIMQDRPGEASLKPLSTQLPPAKTQLDLGQYTIQLASYLTMASAQKELEALKRKGFSGSVMPKGRYTILCVGNFSNKEKAASLLTEFQKQARYKTCFIRRL